MDLSFGTGLWFWASFLPNLKRLDGFDLYPEALAEADRVFAADHVPAGYAIGHAQLDRHFTLHDLHELKKKRGLLVIQDYTQVWPLEIMQTHYDLVTEHGGGLAEMRSEEDLRSDPKIGAGAETVWLYALCENFF